MKIYLKKKKCFVENPPIDKKLKRKRKQEEEKEAQHKFFRSEEEEQPKLQNAILNIGDSHKSKNNENLLSRKQPKTDEDSVDNIPLDGGNRLGTGTDDDDEDANSEKEGKDYNYDEDEDDDEMPSARFRRGEDLPSDLDIGSECGSVGSNDPIDEDDDGDWNMMGAALEREFLGLE